MPTTLPPTHTARFALGSLLLAAALPLLTLAPGGCASDGDQNSASAPSTTTDFERLYKQREYTKAYQSAAAAYTSATGNAKERAALTAGLSLAALQPPKEADSERWLKPLVDSNSTAIAGSASATLGMIVQRKGRHAEAVTLLTAASDKLLGDDRARASMFAGDSLQALGRGPEARSMYERAASSTTDRLLTIQITSRQSTVANDAAPAKGAFTVQIGSFSDAQKARAAADRLAPKAAAAGLATPRVVQTTAKNGAAMHSVRIGRFATRADAQTAQQKLANQAGSSEPTLVMVASGE